MIPAVHCVQCAQLPSLAKRSCIENISDILASYPRSSKICEQILKQTKKQFVFIRRRNGSFGGGRIFGRDDEVVRGVARGRLGRLHGQTLRRTGPPRAKKRGARQVEKTKTRSHSGKPNICNRKKLAVGNFKYFVSPNHFGGIPNDMSQ